MMLPIVQRNVWQWCADELGFVSQAIKVDKEGFLSDYTLPAIANVISSGWFFNWKLFDMLRCKRFVMEA